MPVVDAADLGLFTDLYELTMAQAYLDAGMHDTPASFSLFVRKLPERRGVLLAAGLTELLQDLAALRFAGPALDYLASLDKFDARFLDWLRGFRFTGDVDALPEGTPCFADEPLVEVTAPLAQAQLIETLVMNRLQLPTLLASKAVRVVAAAGGRPVIDFGARRMHGVEASLQAARAFHIAGCAATSNVLAGRLYGLPVSGTMAHSFVQAFGDEAAAFRRFADTWPETVLLVDTYDTLCGVDRVIALSREIEDFRVSGIRLDSGDLVALARQARQRLDAAGLQKVKIFASSSLDEGEIARLLGAGAPIDGFGVGTRMGVSEDAPYLDIAYKLVAFGGEGRLKLSPEKPVLPGRKQVFRQEHEGRPVRDVIARAGETLSGRPLLVPAMRRGEILEAGRPDLEAARARAAEQLEGLAPWELTGPQAPDTPYPVAVSDDLRAYHDRVADRFAS